MRPLNLGILRPKEEFRGLSIAEHCAQACSCAKKLGYYGDNCEAVLSLGSELLELKLLAVRVS